jgi:hypothetical protein
MAKWLQVLGFSAPVVTKPDARLPVKTASTALPPMLPSAVAANGLPAPSVIYGIAASILFVIAIYFLFTGLWFTGFLTLLPAACFLGFALHFLKLQG